ncbi:type II secretion system protein, partial [Acinetobacter baumannii]|uniref:type II secretion system protein n=1 Tax=Acinetobacter baumannii TaxID=470 RepID=UPI0011462BE0
MTPVRTSIDRQRGFTLIEMIVVVLIVSILASAALPLAALHKRRTQEVELRLALRTIRTA